MIYFQKDNGEVFAYSEQTIQQVNRIIQLESQVNNSAASELSVIDKVFFDIRDRINTMSKMTDQEIKAHINPLKSQKDLINEAEEKKSQLRSVADSEVSWRQDAVDAGMATASEAEALAEWKKYRVLLMRVDTSNAPNIAWPLKPAV